MSTNRQPEPYHRPACLLPLLRTLPLAYRNIIQVINIIKIDQQLNLSLRSPKVDNQSKINSADTLIRVLENAFTVSTFLLLFFALWLLWATKDPHEVEAFDYSSQECRTP